MRMFASKRTHTTTKKADRSDKKDCVGEGDFRPVQGSHDEIASSTRTKAYCVISI